MRKLLRFGVFEVDLASGELRKQGQKVRLQEQPFQLLALLLERPGEVVTRESLREKLWPADTFVDFDHSLNTAINKVRDALGDSASEPAFVETIAKRGYRFVGTLERIDPPVASENGAANTERTVHPELEVPLPRRTVTRALFALIQAMYLIFYLAALFHLPQLDRTLDSFLPGWNASAIVLTAIVTAGIGIVVRCYLVSGVAFDYLRLREKFERIFPLLLLLDELWAMAPFLLAGKIGFGQAFAATAALIYVPFAERTLLRLAYPRTQIRAK